MAQINNDSMFKLSYGLFVIIAKGEKDCGCIINTVQQVTQEPLKITVSVNKENYTHDIIKKSGIFNVSVLTEKRPLRYLKNLALKAEEIQINSVALKRLKELKTDFCI